VYEGMSQGVLRPASDSADVKQLDHVITK
jgi:hypothetical protein